MGRSILLVLACMGLFSAGSVFAEDAKKPKEQPQKEDFVLTGKLTKEDKNVKGKDGKDKPVTVYTLTDDKGVKTTLPQAAAPAKPKAGATPPVDLSPFVDKTVTVECSGVKKTKQVAGKDSTTYQVSTVKTIKAAS